MLRWPPDLGGLPSQLASLLPSTPPPSYAFLQERLQWDWRPEQLGAAVRRWPELVPDVPFVVDSVLWGFITAVESVALVSMMCCFFLSCMYSLFRYFFVCRYVCSRYILLRYFAMVIL